MARFRGVVTIEQSLCKGCSFCVANCAPGAVSLSEGMNPKGYHPAAVTDAAKCTGCGLCAMMCPETCIRVIRLEGEEKK